MDRGSTRERLILAAEKLFAEQGIDAVSLREINLAAGQRNTSASHYHFGSKDALIEAIFDYRQGALGRQRLELLAELQRVNPTPSIRDLLTVLAQPLFDLLEGDGCYYLTFLAQLFIQPPANWSGLLQRQDGALPPVAIELNRQLNLPPELLRHRIVMTAQHMVTALSGHCRLCHGAQPGAASPLPTQAFKIALLDGLTAYMAAPVSAELAAALAEEAPPAPAATPDARGA